jgi:hypothetical protein
VPPLHHSMVLAAVLEYSQRTRPSLCLHHWDIVLTQGMAAVSVQVCRHKYASMSVTDASTLVLRQASKPATTLQSSLLAGYNNAY